MENYHSTHSRTGLNGHLCSVYKDGLICDEKLYSNGKVYAIPGDTRYAYEAFYSIYCLSIKNGKTFLTEISKYEIKIDQDENKMLNQRDDFNMSQANINDENVIHNCHNNHTNRSESLCNELQTLQIQEMTKGMFKIVTSLKLFDCSIKCMSQSPDETKILILYEDNLLVMYDEFYNKMYNFQLNETKNMTYIEWMDNNENFAISHDKFYIFTSKLVIKKEIDLHGIFTWRGDYNVFAIVQNDKIMFLEPNGLFHGDAIHINERIIFLKFIDRNKKLILVTEKTDKQCVQIMVCQNWYWYRKLKREIPSNFLGFFSGCFYFLDGKNVVRYEIQDRIDIVGDKLMVVDDCSLFITNLAQKLVPLPFYDYCFKFNNYIKFFAANEKYYAVCIDYNIIVYTHCRKKVFKQKIDEKNAYLLNKITIDSDQLNMHYSYGIKEIIDIKSGKHEKTIENNESCMVYRAKISCSVNNTIETSDKVQGPNEKNNSFDGSDTNKGIESGDSVENFYNADLSNTSLHKNEKTNNQNKFNDININDGFEKSFYSRNKLLKCGAENNKSFLCNIEQIDNEALKQNSFSNKLITNNNCQLNTYKNLTNLDEEDLKTNIHKDYKAALYSDVLPSSINNHKEYILCIKSEDFMKKIKSFRIETVNKNMDFNLEILKTNDDYVVKCFNERIEIKTDNLIIFDLFIIFIYDKNLIIYDLFSKQHEIYPVNEPGLKIVTYISDTKKIVCIAPRGNFESFFSKLLLKLEISKMIANKKYEDAISLITTNLITFDVLIGKVIDIDHFINAFAERNSIITFIEQIYNLFMLYEKSIESKTFLQQDNFDKNISLNTKNKFKNEEHEMRFDKKISSYDSNITKTTINNESCPEETDLKNRISELKKSTDTDKTILEMYKTDDISKNCTNIIKKNNLDHNDEYHNENNIDLIESIILNDKMHKNENKDFVIKKSISKPANKLEKIINELNTFSNAIFDLNTIKKEKTITMIENNKSVIIQNKSQFLNIVIHKLKNKNMIEEIIKVFGKLKLTNEALQFIKEYDLNYIKVLNKSIETEEIIRKSLGLYDLNFTKSVINILQKDLYLDFIEKNQNTEEIEKRILVNKVLDIKEKVLFYMAQKDKIQDEIDYIEEHKLYEFLPIMEKLNNDKIDDLKSVSTLFSDSDLILNRFVKKTGFYLDLFADYISKKNKKQAIIIYIQIKKYKKAFDTCCDIYELHNACEINKKYIENSDHYLQIITLALQKGDFNIVADVYYYYLKDGNKAFEYYLIGKKYYKCYEIDQNKFYLQINNYLSNDIKAIQQELIYFTENIVRFDGIIKKINEQGCDTLTETTFTSNRSRKSTKTKLRNKIGSRYEKEYVLDQIRQLIIRIIKNSINIFKIKNLVDKNIYLLYLNNINNILETIEIDYRRVFDFSNQIYDPERPIIEKIDILPLIDFVNKDIK
ncbi:putative elongator complex protein 1 [Conglomerata obtusa]